MNTGQSGRARFASEGGGPNEDRPDNLGRSGIAKGQGTSRQEQMQVQEDTGNEC